MSDKPINREGWPTGPWDDEPDELKGSFGDVPWMIRRTPLGHLCGYVALPPSHPWRQLEDLTWDSPADVHGGVTWAGEFEEGDLFWVGFDCAHAGDYSPGMLMRLLPRFEVDAYRDLEYVQREVERLAAQAIEAMRVTESFDAWEKELEDTYGL